MILMLVVLFFDSIFFGILLVNCQKLLFIATSVSEVFRL